jgi:hypothetical protein
MPPTTQFLMLLRRYPTDLSGRAKTRRILRKLTTVTPNISLRPAPSQ